MGGRPLEGSVVIQGSKNAALPVLAGALLHRGTTVLYHCPKITDVKYMLKILEVLGCRVKWTEDTLMIDAGNADRFAVPAELGERMRSSVILLGSLLGRNGKAQLPYPGGCTIGKRPIDLHLAALEKMGVFFDNQKEFLQGTSQNLHGAEIRLPFPSVGATENVILSAVLAEGKTILKGAAKEPEIGELCRFLNEKGAKISGMGTSELTIEGVRELQDSSHTLSADRIVAGTYLLGGVLTKGTLFLEKAPAGELSALLSILKKMGALVKTSPRGIYLDGSNAVHPIPLVTTEPYPGFPTDLQSQLMAALTMAEGESVLKEQIFEARFQIVPQLWRMGADIVTEGNQATIRGVKELHGTYVKAKELRGGAALVLAALGACGTTIIQDEGYISRGYEDIGRDLRKLHAAVRTG